MARNMRKILSVRVVREVDDEPDLSYLGEYANQPERGSVCIDRRARGDCGRGEYPWFVCAISGEESGNPESPEQDYQRMEAYNRGDWEMVGIRAEARYVSPAGVIQTVSSGGLWGIESDSDAECFSEVEADELAALRAELLAVGFAGVSIAAAYRAAGLVARKAVARG